MTAAAPAAPRLAQLVGTCLSCLAGLAVDGVSRGTTQPRVAPAIEELGPTFVKLGQALANRPDIVGSGLADELRLLQDSMAPFDTGEARAIIAGDLGAAAEPILRALPDRPVAAASIGGRVQAPQSATVRYRAVLLRTMGFEKKSSALRRAIASESTYRISSN